MSFVTDDSQHKHTHSTFVTQFTVHCRYHDGFCGTLGRTKTEAPFYTLHDAITAAQTVSRLVQCNIIIHQTNRYNNMLTNYVLAYLSLSFTCTMCTHGTWCMYMMYMCMCWNRLYFLIFFSNYESIGICGRDVCLELHKNVIIHTYIYG